MGMGRGFFGSSCAHPAATTPTAPTAPRARRLRREREVTAPCYERGPSGGR